MEMVDSVVSVRRGVTFECYTALDGGGEYKPAPPDKPEPPVLSLGQTVLEQLDALSTYPNRGAIKAVGVLFHEVTHAEMLLRADEPEMSAFLEKGEKHYRTAATLFGVSRALLRLFCEAVAEYVRQRVMMDMEVVRDLRAIVARLMHGPFTGEKLSCDDAKDEADDLVVAYDEKLAAWEASGFEGGYEPFLGAQLGTTTRLTPELLRDVHRILFRGQVGFHAHLTREVNRAHQAVYQAVEYRCPYYFKGPIRAPCPENMSCDPNVGR